MKQTTLYQKTNLLSLTDLRVSVVIVLTAESRMTHVSVNLVDKKLLAGSRQAGGTPWPIICLPWPQLIVEGSSYNMVPEL